MENIDILHRKAPRTYLMSDKVRKATVIIGVVKHINGTKSVGLAAISGTHILFAEAKSKSAEVLIAAMEIVYAHMYFITDEALRIAVLIAEGSDMSGDDALIKKAAHYLCHGMTIEKVRGLTQKIKVSDTLRTSIAEALSTHDPLKHETAAVSDLATAQ